MDEAHIDMDNVLIETDLLRKPLALPVLQADTKSG
jgi:hypothetical protein